MIKKQLFFYLFCSLLIGLYLVTPTTLAATFDVPAESPCGWASLSDNIVDPEDDVVRYSATGTPEGGTSGDFHDEIDIVNVSLTSAPKIPLYEDIGIRFADVPIVNESYVYVILIDNDTDGNADYLLFTNWTEADKGPANVFFLKRLSDGLYFGEGDWYPDPSPFYYLVSEPLKVLYIYCITEAISNLASSKVGVIAAYIEDPSNIYADFVPLTPEAGIPGFPLELVLFSLLTLMGLVLLLQKQRVRLQ